MGCRKPLSCVIESDIPFLNQIEELESFTSVEAGNGYDLTEIRLYKFFARLLITLMNSARKLDLFGCGKFLSRAYAFEVNCERALVLCNLPY